MLQIFALFVAATVQLELTADAAVAIVECKGNPGPEFTFRLDLSEKYRYDEIRHILLEQQCGDAYDRWNSWVETDFDGNTAFTRKLEIRHPQLEGVEFDPTVLSSVSYQPNGPSSSQVWFQRLGWKNIIPNI